MEILTNKEVIAIDQDVLGVQGFSYSMKDSVETWLKPLQNGEWAVCFLNRSLSPKGLAIDWKQLVVTDTVSSAILDPVKNIYQLRDVWTKQNTGSTAKPFNTIVPAHDVVMLRLSK